ncbi:MAG: hypothetical protein GX144_09375 [Clostridiaceae bacterium]|jgi:hypothetical protein|nr:hypothetical protein [Clostridiaceae bacterium]
MQEKSKPYTVKITETAWDMLISHARFLANASVPAANELIHFCDAFHQQFTNYVCSKLA